MDERRHDHALRVIAHTEGDDRRGATWQAARRHAEAMRRLAAPVEGASDVYLEHLRRALVAWTGELAAEQRRRGLAEIKRRLGAHEDVLSEIKRRLGAGEDVTTKGDTMHVRVVDRAAMAERWGQGLHEVIVREVQIGRQCPVCGGPRGEARYQHFHEDGVDYTVSVWENACGHVDKYPDVLEEARRRSEAPALHVVK